jgi:hypothetical protein
VRRSRLTLILLALTVLAAAGLGQGDPRAADPGDSASTQSQLSAQPAPDPALPAIVSAAAKGSATVRTLPALAGWHRHAGPVDVVGTDHPGAQHGPDLIARPRTYPLLI